MSSLLESFGELLNQSHNSYGFEEDLFVNKSGNGISESTTNFLDNGTFGSRCEVHSVPLLPFPECGLDLTSIIESAHDNCASIVFLGSPNNPTGRLVPNEYITVLCERLKHQSLIVIDEAYIDFSDHPGCISLLDHHRNLCIIRTFSKWAGLAGLRCGYCIGHPELIERLLQVCYSSS